MSGILDLLNSDIGKSLISGAAEKAGVSSEQASSVISMGVPVLMGALQKNAESPEGEQGIQKALEKHDGSILDNLGTFFGGGVDDEDVNEGGKIVNKVLGENTDQVTKEISEKSGVDSGSIMKILSVAAPIVMGFLGKQSSGGGNGITSLIGGLLGGGSGGNLLGSITGMLSGSDKKNEKDSGNSITDVIGGLFGK